MRTASEIVHELNAAYQEHKRSMWLSVEDIQPIMHEVWQQACTEAAGKVDRAANPESARCAIEVLRDSKKPQDF